MPAYTQIYVYMYVSAAAHTQNTNIQKHTNLDTFVIK